MVVLIAVLVLAGCEEIFSRVTGAGLRKVRYVISSKQIDGEDKTRETPAPGEKRGRGRTSIDMWAQVVRSEYPEGLKDNG